MNIYKIGGRRINAKSSDNILGVINTVKDIVDVKKTLGVTTDNVLIRTRDKLIALFKKYGLNFDPAGKRNRLSHSDIPDRKVGGDYKPEFARLYNFVIDVFNDNGKRNLAEIFQKTVPVFTPTDHDILPVELLLQGKALAAPEPVTVKDTAADIVNKNIKATQTQRAIENISFTKQASSGDTSLNVLRPFSGLMRDGLQKAGYVAPGDLESLSLTFYDKIVKPATASTYDSDSVDDVVVDSILHFIATVQQKRAQGENMPKIYNVIGDYATRLQEQAGIAAQNVAKQKTGEFVFDNKIIIAGGIGLLLLMVVILASKK